MRLLTRIGIGIIIAFFIHSFLGKISFSMTYYVNVFSILVIVFAVKKGEIVGAFLGSFAGLVQDSFSLGVFGIAGLAKTITGFLAGYISSRINIFPPVRNFILIYVLVTIEYAFWSFIYWFIFSERPETGFVFILQPLSTALLGVCVFLLMRKLRFFEDSAGAV